MFSDISPPGYDSADMVYRIDTLSGDFEQVASLPVSSDILIAQCGLATRSDGGNVVVLAGGENSGEGVATDATYVYDVEANFWSPGPSLPETRGWGRAVQYRNTFLLVGGTDDYAADSNYRGDILRYDPDGARWEVLPQRLPNPDFVNVALIAPQDFVVNCS